MGIIINIYFVWLVYRLNKKNGNPKISFNIEQEEISSIYSTTDRFLFKETYLEGYIDTKADGLPDERHNPFIWKLKIDNKGEFPATNLNIDLELIIKRVICETSKESMGGVDSDDIILWRYKDYQVFKEKIEINYLPALSSKMIQIAYLDGKFFKADLHIKKAKSNEAHFTKKSFLLDTYTYEGLEEMEVFQQFSVIISD